MNHGDVEVNTETKLDKKLSCGKHKTSRASVVTPWPWNVG